MRCAFCSQSDLLTLEAPSSEATAWRAVVRYLRSPLDSLTSVFFPASCVVCEAALQQFSRAPVCDDCWKSLPSHVGTVCLRCSEDLHISVFAATGGTETVLSDQFCQPCRLAPPPFDRAIAFGGYSGTLRSLIHALKYEGILPIADRLGGLLAMSIARQLGAGQAAMTLPDGDSLVVVPVPLHASKLKQRRFNHAELIASATVKELRTRVPGWRVRLAPGLLERRRATQSQAGLSPHQRRANLRGVFFAPNAKAVAGKRVLLIDDIYTTGATARACSQTLRRAGAASIHVATVARPQRESLAAAQFDPAELPMQEDVAFWGSDGTPPVPQALVAASQGTATFRGRHVFGQSYDPRT